MVIAVVPMIVCDEQLLLIVAMLATIHYCVGAVLCTMTGSMIVAMVVAPIVVIVMVVTTIVAMIVAVVVTMIVTMLWLLL